MATDGAELAMGFTGGDMPDAGPPCWSKPPIS
jgi:hypothetical protein